jgi:hypothetical protein
VYWQQSEGCFHRQGDALVGVLIGMAGICAKGQDCMAAARQLARTPPPPSSCLNPSSLTNTR